MYCEVSSKQYFPGSTPSTQVQPSLSIFAVIAHELHAIGNYLSVELLSICVVAYMSVCAYYTVFKIRIFNLYYLAPNHATDEYSLLFSAV